MTAIEKIAQFVSSLLVSGIPSTLINDGVKLCVLNVFVKWYPGGVSDDDVVTETPVAQGNWCFFALSIQLVIRCLSDESK